MTIYPKNRAKNKANRHLYTRVFERFGIRLNRKARVELVKAILDHKARLIQKNKDNEHRVIMAIPIFLGVAIRELNPKIQFGDFIYVVYDKDTRKIVTAIPKEDLRITNPDK